MIKKIANLILFHEVLISSRSFLKIAEFKLFWYKNQIFSYCFTNNFDGLADRNSFFCNLLLSCYDTLRRTSIYYVE